MSVEQLKVKNVAFGKGVPKICVPITGRTKEEILKQAKNIALSEADCVEFRADWYEDCMNYEKTVCIVKEIREVIGEKVFLFTFRTKNEGGEREISIDEYISLCECVVKNSQIDLLDVQAFLQVGLLNQLCNMAHEHHVYVVASNHDFLKTPQEEELVRRLFYMDDMGADLPKLAVMPQSKGDVLTLIHSVLQYYEMGRKKPIITMSMGAMGGITRVLGELYGSSMTFATLGHASAPGQLTYEKANQFMQAFHETFCEEE